MKFLKVVLASFVLASFAMIQGSAAVAASGYTLFGDAAPVHPGNASDTAIQLRSDADPGWGGIDFDTTAGMTLNQLLNLSTDYKFTDASCAGGSPRFQINVDGHNIFVYIGPPPNYTGCAANVWLNTGDLLESALFVDTSQLPGGTFYDTWASALVKYGSHQVTGIQLVADGGWAVAGGVQTVLVDNVMINTTTYTFEEVVASDKNRCKDGGWEDFTSSPGPFKNQGDCVSYFATGGKNKASD
ncbi:MAG TPA: hypothetical protein VI056_01225 [Candidatus Limnocylindria bacterium]